MARSLDHVKFIEISFNFLVCNAQYDYEPYYCTATSCTQISNVNPSSSSYPSYYTLIDDTIYFGGYNNNSYIFMLMSMKAPWNSVTVYPYRINTAPYVWKDNIMWMTQNYGNLNIYF